MTEPDHSLEFPPPHEPDGLLGGLTAAQFMRRHWQKKPLLVRQALPDFQPLLGRAQLFAMAGNDTVESRVVEQGAGGWRLRAGPITRRSLPPVSQPNWTLLVQGVDTHLDSAHRWLQRFAFVPQVRLDDLMVSWASDGAGVGPHLDSYDVFLFQASGQRRWRYGQQKDLRLLPDLPLRVLAQFNPQHEHLLEPGDMLYLPPGWAHEGVAVGGDCMTYSVGFRAPRRHALALELLQRMADEEAAHDRVDPLFRDPRQPAAEHPAAMPGGLEVFAHAALQRLLNDRGSLACALGEVMTEPKPRVWFDEPTDGWQAADVALDRRTRMLYDQRHVFINGEAFRAAGADARLMRRLADRRRLGAHEVARASPAAQALLQDWFEAGWLRAIP